MKKDKKISIIIILSIILIIMLILYFSGNNKNEFSFDKSVFSNNSNDKTNEIKLSTSGEIESSLTENISLHATYYFKKSYVSVGDKVSKNDKLLKYTNNTYLKAPYDGIITEINVPNKKSICLNNHYIQISSINNLKMEFKISEEKKNNINIGDNATIKVSALDDKEYEGVVTSVSNEASNGYFTGIVEFENDGNIKLGYSATLTI